MAIDPNTIQPFDFRDSRLLTREITRKKSEQMTYNVAWAPMRQVKSRNVRLHITRWNGSGLAQFRSVNANTPIMPDEGTVQEQFIELVNLAELTPMTEDEILFLDSPDGRVRGRVLKDALQRTQRLRQRNINRSIWMAWQSVQDQLVIAYEDGGYLTVTWDLAGATYNSWFTSSHLPTASTEWNHTDADGDYDALIKDDMETWADILAIDGGVVEEEIIMHVNTRTWRIVQENKWLRSKLSADRPRDIRPKRSEAAEALGIGKIEIVDSYWWDEDENVRYKHLDDGKALFTGPYIAQDGAPIVEMLDGPVVTVSGGRARVTNNAGLRAETWAREDPPMEFIRVQSARMAVLNHPEQILFATLWS